jgi:hypothetical protein
VTVEEAALSGISENKATCPHDVARPSLGPAFSDELPRRKTTRSSNKRFHPLFGAFVAVLYLLADHCGEGNM